MAVTKKTIKIFIVTIGAIFLIALCAVCILIGLFHFAPEKFLECYEFGMDTYASAKYYFKPYPSNEWVHCERIEDIWKYLENEKVQKITFCGFDPDLPPDDWRTWGEIVEPERIKLTLHLIRTSKIEGYIGVICSGRIKFITDKHRFIIPVEWDDKNVLSYRWKSAELRRQLWKWGYGKQTYKYIVPPKEQTAAILLYSKGPPNSSLAALFGDKKMAEELIFNPPVEDPNGIVGLAGLYKTALLRTFGFEFKKEAGKMIPASNELIPKKLYEGREWLEKILDAYETALKKAEEKEKYFPMELDNPVGRIIFMTSQTNCWKEIGITENTVFDDYIKSEQLKAYFDELGLTDELLAGRSQNKP